MLTDEQRNYWYQQGIEVASGSTGVDEFADAEMALDSLKLEQAWDELTPDEQEDAAEEFADAYNLMRSRQEDELS
jgi:hypothetical protein